jgi:hypothetical protein
VISQNFNVPKIQIRESLQIQNLLANMSVFEKLNSSDSSFCRSDLDNRKELEKKDLEEPDDSPLVVVQRFSNAKPVLLDDVFDNIDTIACDNDVPHPKASSIGTVGGAATPDKMIAQQLGVQNDAVEQNIHFSKQKKYGSPDLLLLVESSENDEQPHMSNKLLLEANSELQKKLDSMDTRLVLEQYYASQLEEKIEELEAKLN